MNIRTRLASMLFDHFIMTVICIMIMAPGLFNETHLGNHSVIFDPRSFHSYLFPFAFAVYMSKDAFYGRSLAKRYYHLQVIDNASGLAASPLQCALRNLSCIIWPIEIFVVINTPARRLGDRLAGTHVTYNEDSFVKAPPLNFIKILLGLLLNFVLMLLLFYGFEGLLSGLNQSWSFKLNSLLVN